MGLNQALDQKSRGKVIEGTAKFVSGYGKAKKAQESKIAYMLRQASVKPIERAFFSFLHIRANRGTNPDNFTSMVHKFTFDAMQREGIIKNDGWGQILGFADYWIVGQPVGIFVVCDSQGTRSMQDCIDLELESRCQKPKNQQPTC